MARRIYISVIAMLIALLPLLPCAAAQYVDFYDGDVTITLPDGWEFYEDNWYDDEYYCIFDAEDEGYNVYVYGYLVKTGMDTDWDMDKESEAFDMYKDLGESLIQAFLIDYEGYSSDETGLTEAKYIKPLKDNQFGYIRVKVNESTHIYVTCREGGYFYILMASNYYVDKSDFPVKEMNSIVRSFYDTGYYLRADEIVAAGYEYGTDSDGMSNTLVLFLVIGGVVIAGVVFGNLKLKGKGKTITVNTLAGPVKMKTPKAAPKAGEDLKSRINDVKSRVTEREEKTTTVHTSYEESLRTLYKSGLLTKSELNDMINKHRKG